MSEAEKTKIKNLLLDQLELLKQESGSNKERLPELSESMVKIIQQLIFLS